MESGGGDDATQQVEQQVADVSEVVLDVVAEDPEEQHVAQQMHEVAMQKLIADDAKRFDIRGGQSATGKTYRIKVAVYDLPL